MELADENNIQLEYIYKSESGQISDGEPSCHSSPKGTDIKMEFDNQVKESIKLSFSQAYASTARPSDDWYFSSIKHSKDSIIFENDEIYVSKEVDFKWLSDKLSSIGKIDSIIDYEDLIAGYNSENYQYIMLIIKSIKSINKRLEYYLKEWYMSSNSFRTMPSNSIKLSGSQTEFARSEIIRIFELLAINSEMEQHERMLLLIYLLKYSYEREDTEIFNEIVQFLFHLSEIRRFNDTLLFTLDDIHYFGHKKANDKGHSEIKYLMKVLNSEFMKTKVNQRIQLLYIALVSNLFWWAKCKISSDYLEYISGENKLGNSSSDSDESQSPWLNTIKEKLWTFLSECNNSTEDSFLGRSPHDWSNDSVNYIMIAFISLMKLWDKEEEILEFIKQFKILELIGNESIFKSSLITMEESCNIA